MRLAAQHWWWIPLLLSAASVCLSVRSAAQDISLPVSLDSTASGPSARSTNSSASVYQPAIATEPLISESLPSAPVAGRKFISSSSRSSKSTHPVAARSAGMLTNWARGSGATALAALAFVVGLFTLFAWVMKRSMPRSAQILPAEVVRVLGRVPLGAKQFGQLMHLGNKIVLVHVTQGGVEKLVEIDNPEEVVRLLAICSKGSKGSQKEFEEIFGQFAKEKTDSGFLGSETSLFTSGNHAKGARYA